MSDEETNIDQQLIDEFCKKPEPNLSCSFVEEIEEDNQIPIPIARPCCSCGDQWNWNNFLQLIIIGPGSQ